MRRKEVIFVCVVAVSAFLIVTANTASDEEFNEDDVEQEIPATELQKKKPSDKEWIDDDGKQEIPTTELPKKKPYDKEWIDDDREQEISTTELPKREPSDEEFVSVNGKQENTTTELPKRKPKLRKIAGDSLPLPCPSPPDIEDAVLPPSDGNEYFEGERVAYRCDYGYVSRNSLNHLSTCILNKTTGRTEWTVPEIACIPRSCGDPGQVINGRRRGNLFTFPNSVEFECEDGYELVGMKARYCQAGGEWSGKLPQCEPIICSIPSDPVNGEVVFNSVEYGAEIHYRCFRGYMRSHTEPRYCETDGSWSGGAPECIEAKCEEPKPPENGEVHFIGVPKVGSIATYSCNPGLKLYGASRTKCLVTGEWTFGPPKCLSACSVPHVENGEMLKLTVRQITRSRQEETYTRVSEGQQIDHDTTLKFQCNHDFGIFEGYKLIEDARTDVTCYEGNWSKDLHCKQMSCQEEPPRTEYGKAVVHRRNHGYTIWYRCDDPNDKKISGNVTCHYGRWIGTPPQCLSLIPCYSKDLDFPGLVKPSQNRVPSSESFAIACKPGYMLSTTAKTMTCKRGKWNVTEDPCPEENKDPAQSTSKPVTVPPLQMRRSTPPSFQPDSNIQPPEQCDCTYVGAGHHVQATVGRRKLRDGDKVRKGETVTFSCKGGRMLTWENGFRTYGNASVTCNTCRRWEVADNPDCKVLEGGGPFIVLDDSLEIQPGGAVEVLIKKPITLRCVSSFHYPLWRFRGQPVHVVGYNTTRNGNVVHYFSSIYIHGIGYEDAGLYTCRLYNAPLLQRTVVNVRVKENKCPLLDSNQFVTYSNGNEFGSWATFSCPEITVLVGAPQIVCQTDGTWSSPEPYCRAITCTLFPYSEVLKVSYSDGFQVRSRATFSCPTNATLVGSEISDCRSDGTWSSPAPYCSNKCSVELLSRSVMVPVVPDMTALTEEFVPFGSTVPLTCDGKFIPEGNSTAVCGEQGRWKIGKFGCASGCQLNIESSSKLRVKPLKDSYRFGETVELSCPDGENMSNDVERLMCLGELTWSDAIPDCVLS